MAEPQIPPTFLHCSRTLTASYMGLFSRARQLAEMAEKTTAGGYKTGDHVQVE